MTALGFERLMPSSVPRETEAAAADGPLDLR
jgi:hypothetical protein